MGKAKSTKNTHRSLPLRQIKHLYQGFREFVRLEASGGMVLIATAVAALVWANSPWAERYFALWHTSLGFELGKLAISHDLHWWINEALMVLLFFVVGLEIKREVLVGELSSFRQAALPIAAAIGGMAAPALIYLSINAGAPGARGWGIPMATDIAFALGVMALVGSRVPISLKVFLTALAIVDDIGAVLIIALFYTSQIAWVYLAVSAGILLLLILANFIGVRSLVIYTILGIALWLMILESGLHATLAGVLLAFTIPASRKIQVKEFLNRAHTYLHDFEHAGEENHRLLSEQQQEALLSLEDVAEEVEAPLQRLEHALHPWVTYAIIPLFALANAGVPLGGNIAAVLMDRVSLGVIAGLVLGKQAGILLATWLATRIGLANLPAGVTWRMIYGVGWLGGIGFTMSLFIAELAFPDGSGLEAAKTGILGASLLTGLVSYLLLRSFPNRSG